MVGIGIHGVSDPRRPRPTSLACLPDIQQVKLSVITVINPFNSLWKSLVQWLEHRLRHIAGSTLPWVNLPYGCQMIFFSICQWVIGIVALHTMPMNL